MSYPGRMSLNILSCSQTPVTISSSQAHSRNIHQTQATAPHLTAVTLEIPYLPTLQNLLHQLLITFLGMQRLGEMIAKVPLFDKV